MNKEVWLPVKGYEGLYSVSNFGRIKSLPRNTTKGKILKPTTNKKNGYQYVSLSKCNKKASKRVHVVVMEAFKGFTGGAFNPDCVIDHIDGDKTNNMLKNLEMVTQKENDRRSRAQKKQHYFSVAVIDLDTLQVFASYTDAAKSLGGGQGVMVRRVCDGQRSHYKKHRFARLSDYEANIVPEYKGKYTKKASVSLWQ